MHKTIEMYKITSIYYTKPFIDREGKSTRIGVYITVGSLMYPDGIAPKKVEQIERGADCFIVHLHGGVFVDIPKLPDTEVYYEEIKNGK